MRILILIILATFPLPAFSQECPVSIRKSGYIIVRSDTSRPVIRDDKVVYIYNYNCRPLTFPFVPTDSVTYQRPLSYWIERHETCPAVYITWREDGLRRILEDRCDITFKALDLVSDCPRPQVVAGKVKVYYMRDAEGHDRYYRIYFLDAEWAFLSLSPYDKQTFYFGSEMWPAVPVEGKTPCFTLEKVLEYRADANFEDKRLIEYKLK